MPGAEGGGAVPAPAPPMGPLASVNPEENYRLAAAIVNQVYDERITPQKESINVRIASKQIKSQAHLEFLESQVPTTGRGIFGRMPDKLDHMVEIISSTPLLGGENCVPQNWPAMFEYQTVINEFSRNQPEEYHRYAAKKKEEKAAPRMFTSLEQKLYDIILSMNIPWAFYAQYQAGPGMKYQLDGAIPSLKIGIEADSKTFHASPEKIAQDKARDSELFAQGWHILRFTEQEIIDHPREIANVILRTIQLLLGNSNNSGKSITL